MAFSATALKVLIASPSDTAEFRNAVEAALHAWNGSRSQGSGFILLPRRWETDAVPNLTGSDGQSVINSQLVDDADIVIALFHIRLGRATERAVSGTVEEITRARDSGTRVHLYFSNTDLPRDYKRDEYEALLTFRKEAQGLGLYGAYESALDLAEKVRTAIEHDIQTLIDRGVVPAVPAGANAAPQAHLLVEYFELGKSETLRVRNAGNARASDIRLAIASKEEGQDAPNVWGAEQPFTLPPGGHFDARVLTHAGTALHVEAVLEWEEEGEYRHSSQSVSLL